MKKLVTIALVLLLAACGSKDKKQTTTPGGGGAAGGGGTTDPGGGVGGGGPDGTDPGGTDPGGGGSTAGGRPTIAPPNLDPDPAQAKAAVDMHLKVARQALSRKPPDADGALREAKLALDIDAASVDAMVVVAHAYYAKRLYDTAEVLLDDLFKRPSAKENAGMYYVMGLVYEKLNKQREALEAYQKAVKLDGNHASARINLGIFQLRNKQYAEAQASFEKAIQLGRDDAEIQTALGAAYRGRSGEYPPPSSERDQWLTRAEATLRKATQLDPNNGMAYYNLGVLYLDADPYPTGSGPMDTLQRLNRAKEYFDKYKNSPGFDVKLYDERIKDVTKLIKREEKKRKRDAREKKGGG